MSKKEIDVLLVEDDPSHVALLLAAVRKVNEMNGGSAFAVRVARDGEEALRKLRAERRPDLILLDLRLPKKNGREVLVEIKADDRLKVVPVVVMTTSSLERDILTAYEHQVSAYVIKPLGAKSLVEIMYRIKRFWSADEVRFPGETS